MGVDITSDDRTGSEVRVTWIDSGLSRDKGWASKSKYMEGLSLQMMTVRTVGLYLGETDDVFVVAQSHDSDNGNWTATQVIAKSCIKAVHWLE